MDSSRADCNGNSKGPAVTSLAALFYDADRVDDPRLPADLDPFAENGLVEAELLEIRVDVSAATIGVLLDVRGAFGDDLGDWALLVAPTFTRFAVELNPEPQPRNARMIVRSIASFRDGHPELQLDTWADGAVLLRAPVLHLFWLDLSEMGLIHPDYDDDEALIRASLPSWTAQSVRILGGTQT